MSAPFIRVQRFGKTVLRCGVCTGPAMLEPSEGGVIPPRVVCLHCGRSEWGKGSVDLWRGMLKNPNRTGRRGRPKKAVATATGR